MKHVWWVIEHKAEGTFLGYVRHCKTREAMPLYRRSDDRKPAMTFASIAAAADELERITNDDRDFEIVPLR
jgi:hypothetical protein